MTADEIIEACAKIADQGVNWEPKENFSEGALRVAKESTFLVARAIRRLKGTFDVSRETPEQAIVRETAAHPFTRQEKWHYSAEEAGLLPCPHCGPGESIVELHQDDIGYWQVGCGRCGSHSGSLPDNAHFPDARERIVTSWNKRDGVPRETLATMVAEERARCAKIVRDAMDIQDRERRDATGMMIVVHGAAAAMATDILSQIEGDGSD